MGSKGEGKYIKNKMLTSILDLILLELGPLDVTVVLVFRLCVSSFFQKFGQFFEQHFDHKIMKNPDF